MVAASIGIKVSGILLKTFLLDMSTLFFKLYRKIKYDMSAIFCFGDITAKTPKNINLTKIDKMSEKRKV